MKIIEVKLDKIDYIEAKHLSEKLGKLNNSITEGEGNLAGFLGEIMFRKIRPEAEIVRGYDYDFVSKGFKIDVKTKNCTSKPRLNYDCSISNHNTKQECDIYVFTRVLKGYEKGWLLGWEYKEEYFQKARFCKQGDIDKSNNFNVQGDCWNVSINELRGF